MISERTVRVWLDRLAKGRIIYDPELIAVMRAHGYSAKGKTRGEVAADAVQFLKDQIETLRARPGAPRAAQLPHAVLVLSFVEGWKLEHAAKRLHTSERQMSRERTRAIRLLRDKLTDAPDIETEPTTWAELVEQLARIEAAVLAMRPGRSEAST